MRRAWLIIAAAIAALSGCVQQPVRRPPDQALLVAQAAREHALAASPDWSLSGRIAISKGRDGGSGRIEWAEHGSDFDIRLSAPITRQSWRMVRANGHVTLEGLDGGTREGSDPQDLLYQALGWVIPVDALASWARGSRANVDDSLEFGSDGLPSALTEGDWSVEYRAWDTASDPPRPKKIFATQGDAKVRLSIDSWDAP